MDFWVEESCFGDQLLQCSQGCWIPGLFSAAGLDEPWSKPTTLTTPDLDISRIPAFLLRRNESHLQSLQL